MNGFSLLLAALTMGVDYGWQPTADGQLEYIIQVEPVTLIAMREGQEVVSQIDPQMRGVRRYRLHVGTEMVPRRGSPPRQQTPSSVTTANLPQMAGLQFGWQALDREQFEFIVQIAPERMTTWRTGEDIVGELPSDLSNVARFRILSGANALPRQGFQSYQTAANNQATTGSLPSMMLTPPRTDFASTPPNTVTGQPTVSSGGWNTTAPANPSWQTASPYAAGGNSGTAYDPNRQTYGQSTLRPDQYTTGTGTTGWTSADPRHKTDFGNQGYNAPSALMFGTQSPATRFGQSNMPVASSVPISPRFDSTTNPSGSTAYANDPYRTNQQPRSDGWTGAAAPSTWPHSTGQAGYQTNPANPPYTASGNYQDPNARSGWNNAQQPNPDWSSPRVASRDATGRPATSGWGDLLSPQGAPNTPRPFSDFDAKDKPWGALTVAVLLLFVSIGGNLYLGWIAARIYRLYLDLADDLDAEEHREASSGESVGDEPWKERRRRRRAILGV